MNAEKLARFCAIRELDYVEQGMSHGVKGAWFQFCSRGDPSPPKLTNSCSFESRRGFVRASAS